MRLWNLIKLALTLECRYLQLRFQHNNRKRNTRRNWRRHFNDESEATHPATLSPEKPLGFMAVCYVRVNDRECDVTRPRCASAFIKTQHSLTTSRCVSRCDPRTTRLNYTSLRFILNLFNAGVYNNKICLDATTTHFLRGCSTIKSFLRVYV